MSETSFKVGNTVKLMSGGPKMTVTGMDERLVECQWWDGAKFQTNAFPPDALVKVEPLSGTRELVRG